MQIIASNKKAKHDYFINNKFEAGLVLTGSEVKSLRINTGSIKESYIVEKNGELWLTNCYIKKYSSSNDVDPNTTRERKILVNKKELNKIISSARKDGMTVVPITLYFNEKELIELRIKYLNDLVDQFVVIEADVTHQGNKKEWNFHFYHIYVQM